MYEVCILDNNGHRLVVLVKCL